MDKISNQGQQTDIALVQGSTFDKTFVWRAAPTIRKSITAITKANPGVVTCVSHGFTTGQKRFISGVRGMTEVNDAAYTVTVITPNSFSIGTNTTSYSDYVSGGRADNGLPVDLTNWTARMQIRASLESAAAAVDMTTANGRIVLGGTAGTVRLLLSDTVTAGISLTNGVYDLELIAPDATVRQLLYGKVTIAKEVTR
jgi:hypothetical protein